MELDGILTALGDPTRRSHVTRLATGPATSGELAALVPVSRPSSTQHLQVLAAAGLVRSRWRGREHWHELEAAPLVEAAGWLAELARRAAVAPTLDDAR